MWILAVWITEDRDEIIFFIGLSIWRLHGINSIMILGYNELSSCFLCWWSGWQPHLHIAQLTMKLSHHPPNTANERGKWKLLTQQYLLHVNTVSESGVYSLGSAITYYALPVAQLDILKWGYTRWGTRFGGGGTGSSLLYVFSIP